MLNWWVAGLTATMVVLSMTAFDPQSAEAAGVWDEQAQLVPPADVYFNNAGRTVAIELNTAITQNSNNFSWGVGSFSTWDRSSDGSWAHAGELPVNGRSLDMDGSLAVIGNPGVNSNAGTVYVLQRQASGDWSTIATLTGNADADDLFGFSVAIAGSWIVVGAPGDDDAASDAGAAYVYRRTDTGVVRTEKLAPSDGGADDSFGSSVAVEPGGRAAVGAPGHDETSHADDVAFVNGGAAYVSELDLNGIRQPLEKIVVPEAFASPNSSTTPTRFGTAVATSEVGLVAVGTGFASAPNTIVVYDDTAAGWTLHSELGATQLADRAAGAALDWEGEVLAVGMPGANSAGFSSGTAYVYEFDRTAGTWSETFDEATGIWTGTEIEPSGLTEQDRAGSDVAVDRDTVVVGVPRYGEQLPYDGASFVFVPGDWTYPSDEDLVGPPAPALGGGGTFGTFQDIAFTATANDTTTGGSVIADLEYQLDGGEWASMEPLDAAYDTVLETGLVTISFATQGTHEGCARGIDAAGNVGDTACIDFEITAGDAQPPEVSLNVDPNPAEAGDDVTVTITADDTATGGSNILLTEYQIDGGDWTSILEADDGAYDSPLESGSTVVNLTPIGVYEICARVADDANNVSEPVCELLNVGDVVPLSVTFTRIDLIGSGLDAEGTADLYGRVGFLIPGREIELSNSDEAITLEAGESDRPYWNFSLDVPSTSDPLPVSIGLADHDPGEVDDTVDITTNAGTDGVIIDIDLTTGTWPGAPLAQECFVGGGADAGVVCIAVSVRSPDADQDGDGIHDAFELYGYDHDGDGNVDVDFPALGANVCRPDIPIEIDWMVTEGDSHAPTMTAIQAAQDSFASAPVLTDPLCVDDDGNTPPDGINLIVDRDEEIDLERAIDCDRIVELTDDNLSDARRPFFIWSGWVHDILKEGGTVSGVACGRAPSFVVSLGNYPYGNTFGSESNFGVMYGAAEDQRRVEAATFMHEVGHKLGLGHGGADSVNYKPNHLSVMNYAFSFFWLLDSTDTSGTPTGTLDFSRGQSRTLDEADLSETPLGTDNYLTLWDDPNDDASAWLSAPADQELDWNQNAAADSGYSQDLNRDGDRVCVSPGADLVLSTLIPLDADDVMSKEDSDETDSGEIDVIRVGPNGICETTAFAGDSQRLPVGFDADLLTSDNEWGLITYPAANNTFGATAAGSGEPFPDLVEHIDADPSDPEFQAVLDAWRSIIDAAPTIDVDTTDQTVQYSDGVTGPAITVTDSDSTPTLTLDASAPSWVSLSTESCESFDNGFDDGADGTECTWHLTGTADAPAGTYPVDFTASDGTTDVAGTTEIIVETEDATVDVPANPTSVQVTEDGGGSEPFTVGIAITEREPDTPSASAAPGDLTNVALADVTITLVPIGPGSTITPGGCTAGSVTGSGYDQSLPIDCDFDEVPVNTYTIDVTVEGDFYSGTGEDVLTVFDPSLGFTTGGGWLTWPDTAETANFGFTISYNKKATNVRGSFVLIRHLDDSTIYRVKSNAIEGLSVGDEDGFGWASFTTKATYIDPSMTDAEGNYEVTVYVEDHGSDGDRLWIQVRDRNGVVVDELSLATPATSNAISISRGSITVPHTPSRR